MEMSTSDHSIIGMPPKEVETQKWEINPLGAGHSIRNFKTGKYLSVKTLSKDTLVVASDYPVAWFIREVRINEENAMFYEVRWPMTDIMFELGENGSSAPKTKVIISDGQLSAERQRCRYWRVTRIRQPSFYQSSSSASDTNGQAFSITGLAERWKSFLPARSSPLPPPRG